MTLTPGTRLGPYEILAPIGAGGMGEVYRAKDARLDRFVAIKVLPEHLAKHPESLARFEREAKAVAALNHAHITALFDLGREGETVYAVMELLEGQTLASKLEDGPLSPRLATELAIQMAQGLAAAHGKGVVHRDLKPANLWITSEGRLKILDFGLAKQLAIAGPGPGSALPTQLLGAGPQTEKGMILGTMGYMSPEQVRGEAVDARSDIFSFGVVLFEMLTGKRAFGRHTAADTMAAILKEDPPALQEASNPPPLALRRVVEHCLEKLPARRFQNAEDLAFALGNLSDASSATGAQVPLPDARRAHPGLLPRWLPWALVGILLLGVAGLLMRRPASTRPAPVRQWDLLAGSLDSTPVVGGELSPDGRRIVYALDGRLWVRELSEGQAREVVGSEQTTGIRFWSPDGANLVFNAQGKIWRSSLGSEAPLAICEVPGKDVITGGAWLESGDLLLAVWRGDLYRVPSTGGAPQVEVALDHAKEIDFHQFCVLPDGESVITVLHGVAGAHQIELIRGKSRTVLLQDDKAEFRIASYLLPGFLLVSRSENLWTRPALWAAPFSTDEGRVTGPAFLVAQEFGVFTSTRDGLVAFRPSKPAQLEPVWLDENGRLSAPAAAPLQEATDPALSPDGKRVAVAANTAHGRDIWILDLAGRTWSPATDTRAGGDRPKWSPDGKAIIFQLETASSSVARSSIFPSWTVDYSGWSPVVAEVPATGNAPFRKVIQGNNPLISPDGTSVVYAKDQSGHMDIQRVPREGGDPVPVLATPSSEMPLGFSPDGNWLLFASNESGQVTPYVMRYPGGGEKKAVTVGPIATSLRGLPSRLFRWTSGGRFYYWDGKSMQCLDVDTRHGLVFGPSRTLFKDPGQGVTFSSGFDVDPRTGRILVLRDLAGPSLDTHVIRIIENVGTLLAQRSGRD